MKRRKPSAVDNASDARIAALLGAATESTTQATPTAVELEGGTGYGLGVRDNEDEEILDKMFISQDVEKEREVTFADIESRG